MTFFFHLFLLFVIVTFVSGLNQKWHLSDRCKEALERVATVQLNSCRLSPGQNNTNELGLFCDNIAYCSNEAKFILADACTGNDAKQPVIETQLELGILIEYSAKCVKNNNNEYCPSVFPSPTANKAKKHNDNGNHVVLSKKDMFCHECWPLIVSMSNYMVGDSSTSQSTKDIINKYFNGKKNMCSEQKQGSGGSNSGILNEFMIATAPSIKSFSPLPWMVGMTLSILFHN